MVPKIIEFWNSWNNKSDVEKRAILSVNKSLRMLFEYIAKNKIFSIYVNGSFVRREMLSSSDIDIHVVVRDNQTFLKIMKLDKEKGEAYRPAELLPISLWELKTNKRYAIHKGMKGKPDIFLRRIKHFPLIYGTPLSTNYPVRHIDDELKGHIHAFEKQFLPLYKKKELSFSQLVKQVFWLAEKELRVRGIEPEHSFAQMANQFDKKHIIHLALKYRLSKPDDKGARKDFVVKLKNYLNNLSKLAD